LLAVAPQDVEDRRLSECPPLQRHLEVAVWVIAPAPLLLGPLGAGPGDLVDTSYR
jgi:hypothetical protein